MASPVNEPTWYDSKELLDSDKIHSSRSLYENLFELNIGQFWNDSSTYEDIFVPKKFRPIHYEGPYHDYKMSTSNKHDSIVVKMDNQSFGKNQSATTILKLKSKLESTVQRVAELEEELESTTISGDAVASSPEESNHEILSKVAWLAWPIVFYYAISRCLAAKRSMK